MHLVLARDILPNNTSAIRPILAPSVQQQGRGRAPSSPITDGTDYLSTVPQELGRDYQNPVRTGLCGTLVRSRNRAWSSSGVFMTRSTDQDVTALQEQGARGCRRLKEDQPTCPMITPPRTMEDRPMTTPPRTKDDWPMTTPPRTKDDRPMITTPRTKDDRPMTTLPRTKDDRPMTTPPRTKDGRPMTTPPRSKDDRPMITRDSPRPR